jgi:hypothetical protein
VLKQDVVVKVEEVEVDWDGKVLWEQQGPYVVQEIPCYAEDAPAVEWLVDDAGVMWEEK